MSCYFTSYTLCKLIFLALTFHSDGSNPHIHLWALTFGVSGLLVLCPTSKKQTDIYTFIQ